MKKFCVKCGERIKEDRDRYVSLLTNEGKKLLEEKYFHITCWQIYFKDCVANKIAAMRDKALGMMRGMMGGVSR